MPARTGRQYLNGLREQDREVWLRGERVKDVTSHPGLAGGARAIASLYDMQCDPKYRDEMTYVSPTTGDRVGLSFINPRTREELEARRVMMLNWARTTCGMMGRSPDFMNVTLAAWGAASEYFARGNGRPEFAQNIRRYYEFIRENDIVLTHSLINLQRSRNVSGMFNLQEGTALRVTRETSRGLVVRGARVLATLGPLADEIAVYSQRLGQHTEDHSPFAVAFAIPCGTPGPALPLPRQRRPWPFAFRPATRIALRGDGLHRVLRRCRGAVGAGVPPRRRRAAERRGQRDALLGAFGASGCGEEPCQVRVRAWSRAADDRDAR
jgi:4-hydroxyphenylacetate 3-monooxygenase